jgi:plastocyanin
MNSARTSIITATVAAALAFPAVAAVGGNGGNDGNQAAAEAVVVHFGQAQPQTPDPAPPAGVGAAVTHFLTPNDLTIKKGQAVNFVVNGGGHGIAIHSVSKDTTREDIAQDLCDGTTPENADPIVDRRNRAAVCNGTAVTTATINGASVLVTGTQNLDYTITDGKDAAAIHTGFNLPIPGTTPPLTTNPRVDDIQHSHRILATSGRAVGDTSLTGANGAGAFLAGTTAPTLANPNTVPPTPANPTGNPGNRINVQFLKTGRYLVICMNRAHSLNDHMFGFVNVVGDEEEN